MVVEIPALERLHVPYVFGWKGRLEEADAVMLGYRPTWPRPTALAWIGTWRRCVLLVGWPACLRVLRSDLLLSAPKSTPILRGITLDLFDSRSTNQVFHSPLPKAIAFYKGKGDAKRNAVDHVRRSLGNISALCVDAAWAGLFESSATV